MNKNKTILYALAVALGLSTSATAYVNGGYGEAPKAPAVDKDGSLFPGGPCKSCSKDGSLFPGGPCKSCSKDGSLFPGPCKKCEARRIEQPIKNYVIPYTPVVYQAVQRNCCQMAPLALDHVDFRIKDGNGSYSNRLGNYRFRIFGCRRFNKEARLNAGRVMEKNINFATVFEETVNDCYRVLPMPEDLCLQTVPTELPEYVLTAEITDYFMNVCDEYDWDKAEKTNQRKGSSEITVTWRLMDLTKSTVYWKGESTGYGDLYDGEANGEVKLIERAFADATSNLRNALGFEDQLMQRVDPISLAAQRNALVEEERALNPIKCGYLKEYECAKNCEISRPGVDLRNCQPTCPTLIEPQPAMSCQSGYAPVYYGGAYGYGCEPVIPVIYEDGGVIETGEVVEEPAETEVVVETQEVVQSCIDENGNVKADSNCQVVDDTWIDTGDVKALDQLCVVTANPCKALSPETVYRLRSSVVQIDSPNGKKGAGLLISDSFILTSGDLIDPMNNSYKIKTIRNDNLTARAVRVNPSKNTALLMLDKSVEYTPLALNLQLPEVGRNGYLTLGLLDVKDFKDGEDYLENSARVEGYRYTEEKGAEILANTFIQNVTVGGALFYKDCTISGMAHSGIRTNDGLDVYIPTETALRSLGISICGHEYVEESPWQQTVYKPVTEQIQVVQQQPEVMKPKDRK
ncbi:MAG: hypothetical protein J6N49_01460 [Alphaproteobacteria bacterium]|nr:hypothetical protein [Alphaproteobacteria bacterium]